MCKRGLGEGSNTGLAMTLANLFADFRQKLGCLKKKKSLYVLVLGYAVVSGTPGGCEL